MSDYVNSLVCLSCPAIPGKVLVINPLTGTLKPQSNGPLYNNMVIGTLAVNGWFVAYLVLTLCALVLTLEVNPHDNCLEFTGPVHEEKQENSPVDEIGERYRLNHTIVVKLYPSPYTQLLWLTNIFTYLLRSFLLIISMAVT